eukprot:gene8515-11511_t
MWQIFQTLLVYAITNRSFMKCIDSFSIHNHRSIKFNCISYVSFATHQKWTLEESKFIPFLGRSILLKRDDLLNLTDLKVNGNKARKLKFLLNNNYDKNPIELVASYGGSQSNSMLAIAKICCNLKIPYVYFCLPINKIYLENNVSNVYQSLKLGMKIVEVNAEEYGLMKNSTKVNILPAMCLKKLQNMFNSSNINNSFWIPQGGACKAAEFGVKELAKEIFDSISYSQHITNRLPPWKIFIASGTGTTAYFLNRELSLLIEQNKDSNLSQVTVIAVPCATTAEELYLQMSRLEIESPLSTPNSFPYILSTKYVKINRFANPNSIHLSIWKKIQLETGIDFDLIYAPRAFEIILSHIKNVGYTTSNSGVIQDLSMKDWMNSNIIYYHCGGTEGNPSQLMRYKYNKIL